MQPNTIIYLSDADKDKCWKFAEDIIQTENQYDRMMKQGITGNEKTLCRIQRTYVGKIGEMAFYRFLEKRGFYPGNLDKMFEIYEGEQNVDKFDFETADGETVDVKAAVFSYHWNLVVPLDQFENQPKDYYVGVKTIIPSYIGDYGKNLHKEDIGAVHIYGYATRAQMEKCRKAYLGEKWCKPKPLKELTNIENLLELF